MLSGPFCTQISMVTVNLTLGSMTSSNLSFDGGQIKVRSNKVKFSNRYFYIKAQKHNSAKHPEFGRLYQMQSLLDHFRMKFRDIFCPDQALSVEANNPLKIFVKLSILFIFYIFHREPMNRQAFGITTIIRSDDGSNAESLSVRWHPVKNKTIILAFYRSFLQIF